MCKSIMSVLLLLSVAAVMSAQTRIGDRKIEVLGDSVTVSFTVEADKGIPSLYKEVIVPYLHNDGDSAKFEACEVYGRQKYMREKQQRHLLGDRQWEPGKNSAVSGQTIRYVSSVPLKNWMTSADLGVKRYLSGCNCEKDFSDESLSRDNELFKVPALPARLAPGYFLEDAVCGWDFGHDDLEIIFKVSKAELDTSVYNNYVTIGKILEAVDKIFDKPHYKIDRIEISGFASPEGGTGFNSWLGENRAKALIDYIISSRPHYDLTEDHFIVQNGEENWAGLGNALEKMEFAHKASVMDIISSDLSSVRKKSAIQALDAGKVWAMMLKEIYPQLRCARYKAVYYKVSDVKEAEVINAASAMIRNGEYAGAYEMLNSVSHNPAAYNPTGVALMMLGRYEEAIPWFRLAMDDNCPSAFSNMEIVEAELEKENQHKRKIEEYLSKYN